MKTKVLKWIVSILTLSVLFGCSNNNEPEMSNSSSNELDKITTFSTSADIYDITDITEIDNCVTNESSLSYNDFVMQNSNESTRSSSTSSGVIRAVGYTNMTKISTGKRIFTTLPKGHPLQNHTTYPFTRYYFGNRITIPHGATLSIPTTEFPEDYPIGWNPNDLSKAGYRFITISETANGDVYELQTVIDVIEYNSSGQHIGTFYVPFRVGNPSTDMYFEYAWAMNSWFN